MLSFLLQLTTKLKKSPLLNKFIDAVSPLLIYQSSCCDHFWAPLVKKTIYIKTVTLYAYQIDSRKEFIYKLYCHNKWKSNENDFNAVTLLV